MEEIQIDSPDEFGFCIKFPACRGILPEYFSREELARNRFNELKMKDEGKECALERLGTRKGSRNIYIDVVI